MSANFTPNYEKYKKLPPFKGMVLQNFPFIEEDFDAITNYQLLCKVVEYLKNVIANEELVEENVTNLYNAYVSLQNYVNTYFDNLDVQEEINNKLDAMAESGELSTLIGTYVTPYIDAQNERINAIDEKVDNIASGSPLVATSTSGMTDTTRIYVNTTDGYWYYYNGTTWVQGGVYQSTGIGENAVQLNNLDTGLLKYHEFITDFVLGTISISQGYGPATNRIRFYRKVWLEKGTIINFTPQTITENQETIQLQWSLQSFLTTDNSSGIENIGWKTDEQYYIDESHYYGIVLRYTDNRTIEVNEIPDIASHITLYIPLLNYAGVLKNWYSAVNPFILEEKQTNNVITLNQLDESYYICFNNDIEYYNASWATNYKLKARRITYDLGEYGEVDRETSSRELLKNVTIPNNYVLYLNVVTGVMGVKSYGELEAQDGILIRNARGYAVAGAFTEIINYWKNKDYYTKVDNLNTTINYDFNVKNVAHRGYSSVAPENTLPAYRLAAKNNFKYVECDISFTSDNVPVLLHDSTIDRTSDGTGNINDLTYEQVLQYDFGSWKSSAYTGTKIPTLEQFLSLCRDLGLYPYIELKNTATYTEAQIQSLVDLTEKYGMKDKATWISFTSTYLGYVKNYDSKARLGFVVNNVTSENITTALGLKTNDNEVFIDCSYSNVDNTGVNLCISNNLPLEIWTVNSSANIINSNKYISGYTSNDLLAGKILYENSIND